MKIRLRYEPPLDWNVLAGFFGARAIPDVEAVGPEGYRRAVRFGRSAGVIEIRAAPRGRALEATVPAPLTRHAREIERRLRRLFDLDADPAALRDRLGRDPLLGPRLGRLPGIRVPGAWDGFELAVRAILGQQVSVRGARTLAGRLVERCGETLPGAGPGSDAPWRVFPTPERLAAADLSGLGLTGARARALGALARAVSAGEVSLEGGRSKDEGAALLGLPGIGPWTSQYVAMRALGDRDAFPAGDLGVRRALARGAVLPSLRETERLAEPWRPFRAYAVMLLWLG